MAATPAPVKNPPASSRGAASRPVPTIASPMPTAATAIAVLAAVSGTS